VNMFVIFFFLITSDALILRTNSQRPHRRESRIALVLSGEAFRLGQQGSRTRACSLAGQSSCSQAQIKLIVDPLQKAGVKVDVFISTYHTDQLRDTGLVDLWNNTGLLTFAGWCKEANSSQGSCVRTAFAGLHSRMQSTNLPYKLIIHTRHDFVPKNELLALAALEHIDDDKIWLAPFKMTHGFRFFPDRVPDTVQIFTSNVFPHMMKLVENNAWPGERIWRDLEPNIGRDHMGFITHYFADSDPAKKINPMYRFCGRGEGPEAEQWMQRQQTLSTKAWGLDSKTLAKFDFASNSPKSLLQSSEHGGNLDCQ